MTTVAFDMIGTFFDLGVVRGALAAAGAPDIAIDLWVAQSLRDYFAASQADRYLPLATVLRAELPRVLAGIQLELQEDALQRIVTSFSELEPAEGAREACHTLRDAAVDVVALTNGAKEDTVALLERCSLRQHFRDVLSADDVGRSKPDRQVYEQVTSLERDAWLVAAHAWDILGAGAAGLRTAWVGRRDDYMSAFPPPDVIAADLADAAEQIAASV